MENSQVICSPELYAKISRKAAESYINGVLDGSIVVNRWIKAAVERGLKDRASGKYDLIYDKVDQVYLFCSRLNIQNNLGKIEQFKLSPYQSWMLLEIFLYYEKDDGARRFTEIVYYTARKSGKTMIAAIISFFMAILAGYASPQVYFAASGAKQAGILLKYCKEVAESSDFLACRTDIYSYDIRTKSNGFFVATANKTGGELDGFRPLVTVLDECHALKGNELRNAFQSGMGWSSDTLFISISTAGTNILSFFKHQIDNAKRVLDDGDYVDDKTLYFLYTLDDGDVDRDDILTNQDIWMKANPNLGITPPLKRYKSDMVKAWTLDEERAKFIIKNFNIFDDQLSIGKIFSMKDINRNVKDLNIEDFYGSNLYLGLDLAPLIDISSLSAFLEKDGMFYTWSDLFVSGSKEALFRKGTTLDLTKYEDFISINYGFEVTNYPAIVKRAAWYGEHFNVIGLGFDPAFSGTMAMDIENKGIDTYPVKQYHAAFNECVMMLENNLAMDTVKFDSNPLLRYMFNNALVNENDQGMRMPAKKDSKLNGDAIDAVMSTLMAMNMYIGHNVQTSAIYQYLESIRGNRR